MTGSVQPGRTRVAFLGGLGRSGSTLFERMVGELPSVCPLGEVVHLWQRALLDDERCGCGEHFSGCPFWTAVGEKAFGGWDRVDAHEVLRLKREVDRNRFVPALALPRLARRRRAAVRAYLWYYERLYAAAARISGAEVVVDSSKHASLAFCLRWSTGVDLRVLHMVRDSPAVAYSWGKTVERPEAPGSGSMMPRYGPLRVAVDWNVYNAMFRVLAALGVPSATVRYEDVVADPRRAMTAFMAHVDLPDPGGATGFVADGTVRLTRTHTVAGNPMRFATGAVPLRQDDAWRGRLPSGAHRVTAALTYPQRRHFGYTGGAGPDRRDEEPRT